MQIKGAAIKSTHDFMYDMYRELYDEWFHALPPESQTILSFVRVNAWYPIEEGVVAPTRCLSDLLFNGATKKGAFQAGKYSAMTSLHGLYKLYVRFSSPAYVIERGARILASFYRPSTFTMLERKKNSVYIEIGDCDLVDEVIEYRMAGWIYKALELSGCKTIHVELTESFQERGRIRFRCSWK